ncbi:hypothetical protein [Streptomyces sp. NPDC017086]|uniref:hypothetical protein n=1 Tax=Streptomyces sp. NPDC017086 TaxID=3364976 RepID=UPI0037889110
MTTLWRIVPSALQTPGAPGREETIAPGAAALALKRTPQASVEDVLEIGLYEFSVVIELATARAALASLGTGGLAYSTVASSSGDSVLPRTLCNPDKPCLKCRSTQVLIDISSTA